MGIAAELRHASYVGHNTASEVHVQMTTGDDVVLGIRITFWSLSGAIHQCGFDFVVSFFIPKGNQCGKGWWVQAG